MSLLGINSGGDDTATGDNESECTVETTQPEGTPNQNQPDENAGSSKNIHLGKKQLSITLPQQVDDPAGPSTPTLHEKRTQLALNDKKSLASSLEAAQGKKTKVPIFEPGPFLYYHLQTLIQGVSLREPKDNSPRLGPPQHQNRKRLQPVDTPAPQASAPRKTKRKRASVAASKRDQFLAS